MANHHDDTAVDCVEAVVTGVPTDEKLRLLCADIRATKGNTRMFPLYREEMAIVAALLNDELVRRTMARSHRAGEASEGRTKPPAHQDIIFDLIVAQRRCERGEDGMAIQRAIAALTATRGSDGLQSGVAAWMLACFGAEIAADVTERNHRFLEESLELMQAGGCTASEAHQLVDYVYGRSVGELGQEIGGVMVTLAALCVAHGLDMHALGNKELALVWTKIDVIRAKQAGKPKHSPLPLLTAPRESEETLARKLFESTAKAMGFVHHTPWTELAEETRQMYRDESIRRSAEASQGSK